MGKTAYSEDFFSLHLKQSLSSAEQVIPVVKEFVQPLSVADIGCGIGTWLSVWKKQGVTDILGVDGDYVKKEQLLVEQQEFVSHDLSTPFSVSRKFDLVTSLEVGEHIDAKHANSYVETLCGLGDIVLFSAAIPGQEGTYHINEQYPNYWAAIFFSKGFVAIDCLRGNIWDNEKISWWYRQNIVFFVRKESLSKYEKLADEYKITKGAVMSLVHPELLKMKDARLSYFKKNLHNPLRTIFYYAKKMIGRQ